MSDTVHDLSIIIRRERGVCARTCTRVQGERKGGGEDKAERFLGLATKQSQSWTATEVPIRSQMSPIHTFVVSYYPFEY